MGDTEDLREYSRRRMEEDTWRRFWTAIVEELLPGPTMATTGTDFLLQPGVWQQEHWATPSLKNAIACSMAIRSVQQESAKYMVGNIWKL